ncbi:MAG: lipopolysaccharide export system permease protein [Gammaproteobacteria bacterium]|jgi:lipopolysaccharide export system permease protein
MARGSAELIIDGYITREVLKPLLLIVTVLILIFVGYSSGRYLSYAADGLLQLETLVSFILIKMVIALEVLLPIALYLSIVLGLGRLESGAEITAIRASGIGNGRVMRAVVGISIVLALIVAAFSMYGRPIAYEKSYWIKAKAEAEIEIDKLQSGNFYDSEERERTIFVEEVDKKTGQLERIFIRGDRGGFIHVIYAGSGIQEFDFATGRRVLTLMNARVYLIGPHGATDRGLGKFKTLKLRLDDVAPLSVGYKRKAAPTSALASSNSVLDIAEFQWRLSTPISTVLLGILAVLLSRSAPRSSRYTKTIGALLIYIVYFNLNAVAKTWVETGVVGKFPGIWWVQFCLLMIIVALILRPKLAFKRAAERVYSPPLSPGVAGG